jgi:hypothetical protein
MRALATAVTVIAAVLLGSGCASSGATKLMAQTGGGPEGQVMRTVPLSGTGPLVVPISAKTRHSLEQDLYIARFLSPTRLAIPRIVGSSNCPSVPDKLIVRSPHAIWIDLVTGSWSRTASGRRMEVPHSPGICLDDLHPVPVVVAIDPSQIDVHHQLKVSLYYPKAAIRRYKRPVVVTVSPLATARVREEVRVARSSNVRLFSIFPKVPGERRCLIPRSGRQQRFAGICQTSVRSRPTHEPSVSVTFTESWWPHCPPMAACSPRALRHHTWQVIEGETMVKLGTTPHVYATHSSGARPPQLASPRIREEVKVARSSSRYFSIFPALPGKRHCAIPDAALGAKPFRGMCSTSVPPVLSHGPAAIVTFTERWGQASSCPPNGYCMVPYRHHTTWQVSIDTPLPGKLHVMGTRLSGATPPQLYK